MTECGIRASIGRKLPQLRLLGSSSLSTVAAAVVLLLTVTVVVVVVVVVAGVEYGYGVDRGLHVMWMLSGFHLFSHLAFASTFLSAKLFLFCFFSAATLMYRTTPFFSVAPLSSAPTSYLRDELLRDVLRYTLDRGIFSVSCGNDAERTVASMPITLFGIALVTP